MSPRVRFFVPFVLIWLLICAFTLWLSIARPGHAQEIVYTPADTLAAIDAASDEIGVDHAWLYATVKCETASTFNPYSVGRQGELGAVQLHPRGELQRFYAVGYLDPFSPYQAVRFMAQRFSVGGAGAWSCS